MAKALKPKVQLFADNYLRKPDGAQAARDAGYSDRSAASIAHELLQRDDVKAYLAEHVSKAAAVLEHDVERITTELARIGFADTTSIFIERDGVLMFKPLAEWPAEIRACIASIETSRRVIESGIRKVKDPDEGEDQLVHETEAEIVTKVKFHPKIEALKLLAMYRRMFGGDIVPPGAGGGFVGLAITVAPGAQANIQVNTGKGAK